MCGSLSVTGRLKVAAGGLGDALVMCPAEGEFFRGCKGSHSRVCQPAAGHWDWKYSALMDSDSCLKYIGVLKESVVIIARDACSTGSAIKEGV